MAIYNLSKEPKKVKKSPQEKNKIIGIFLVTISIIAFFALLTSFIGFLKSFLLGSFGLFAYPLFITTLVIGVALINNKKYVMTTKYVVYLSFSIIALLCILHMIFIDPPAKFFDYLGYCYTRKKTIGGIFCGIFTAPFIYILNKAGAYIIFSLILIIFGALLADYIFYLNKSDTLKKSANLSAPIPQIKQPILNYDNKSKPNKKEKSEKVNIVLDAKKKAEPVEDIAKRKLGLIKSNSDDIIDNIDIKKQEKDTVKVPSLSDKKSVKEYLLTPDRVLNLKKYSSDAIKRLPTYNETVKSNISTLKNEEPSAMPSIILHDDSSNFNDYNKDVQTNQKPFITPSVEPEITEVKEEKPTNASDDFANSVLASLMNESKFDENVETIKPDSGRRRGMVNLDQNFTKPKVEQQKIDIVKNIEPIKNIKYQKPGLELLTTKSMDPSELNEDVENKKTQLENALETFGIPAKVIEVVVGPAVTRYELEMPAGISVKKILNHSEDIAYNLAANGDIRIEAPIPGKSAVGIEVPNERIATVGLRELIESKEFQSNTKPLTFVLGKDIAGDIKLCNLAKMPHLLVAGSTGSGKSVCLNAVILSLIYKTSPDDVRLILIDPKQVEFSIYNGLPHLLIPNVVTDPDMALNALNWAVDEMERRFTLFKNTRSRDITEYANCADVLEGRSKKLPYIVIIIDELADLLMTGKKEIEEKISRLAQKARAAGIHLILATQRPSVDVITGTMKNNFTSRISFKLMSFADSKTILDQSGAEKLLGKGDMLYKPSDASEPRRIQGCFVTGTEVSNIVDFVKENNSEYDYDSTIEDQITNPAKADGMSMINGEPQESGFDVLMPQALKCAIENGQVSISMLQRKLVIGYPRAARIIDQMESRNFITPQDGSKPRTVLATMEDYENLFGEE